jgi:predicted outer membrane repeat protein
MVTVNTELDSVDAGDGLTSLREATAATNTMSGPDEITFDFGHDGPAMILLKQGELKITDSLTINGPGAELLTIDASGNDPTPHLNDGKGSRVFYIDDGKDNVDSPVTIRGLTLTGADVGGFDIRGFKGGAIQSWENLTVTSSTISGNSAGSGGGIYVYFNGNLTVTSSTISGNSAQFGGGGIRADGNVTVTSSTFSGNSASGDGGGGILAGKLTVQSSTISGNSSIAGSGGGIKFASHATIKFSTISGNSAANLGDGIFSAYGGITITNSIVAGNFGSDLRVAPFGSQPVVEYSLIGDNQRIAMDEAPVGMPDALGNLIGGPIHGVIDAKLGPLANNGGPTFTHALLPGSPAINAGEPNAVAGMNGVPLHDQRGAPIARIIGGRIDMGAVESQPIPAVLFGDYNVDGLVDIVDYVIWRATLGDTLTAGSGADGSGNGLVDQADYQVWRRNFGSTLSTASTAIASGASIDQENTSAGAMDEAAVRFSAGWFDEPQSDGSVSAPLERVVTAQNHRRYLDLLLMLEVSSPLSSTALDAAYSDDQDLAVTDVTAVGDIAGQLLDGLEDNVS